VKPSAAVALPPITEKAFREQVLTVARTCGYVCWYDVATNAPRRCVCGRFSTGPRNPAGWPDLVLVRPATERRPGRLLFVELKKEKGTLKAEQIAWLSLLGLAGAETYVIHPSELQEFALIIRADERPAA
jgi:hypothetical protein